MKENVTRVGASLPTELKGKLAKFLLENSNVFVWSAADMPDVPSEVITHQLNVNKKQRLVHQKRRYFANERMTAIEAGFIREEKYSTWLANVVMIKKPTGK